LSRAPIRGSIVVVREAAMSRAVTLFTDRTEFEGTWRTLFERHGVGVTAIHPERLPEKVSPGSTLVVDGAAGAYDEDELLAHLGLARALGAFPAVSLPPAMSQVDDLVEDLCGGLVVRTDADAGRIASVLARRAGASASPRFEYLTVSPRGAALLAILADGTATLVDRPAASDDDGSDVESIAIAEDAASARVELASGKRFVITAADIAARERELLAGPVTSSATGTLSAEGGLADLDGPRLGARVRALRLAAGLTQAELARRTGIHRPNIARVEAGRHTPSLETLARLAAAIGVPTTRVLVGD
jgi:DNA-binding XRE family transcriptional regulator